MIGELPGHGFRAAVDYEIPELLHRGLLSLKPGAQRTPKRVFNN